MPDSPVPNILEYQQHQRREFCTKVTTHFYCLPVNQKVLDVHVDENWFNGYVSRSNHKSCSKLGTEKKGGTNVNHKNYIPKVMVITVTVYAFKNGSKGGGDGLKIGCYRTQGVKKANNQVNKFNQRTSKHNGLVVREAGDIYLVDCNVTGLSMGGTGNLKLSLWYLFEHEVFPAIEKLVAEEG